MTMSASKQNRAFTAVGEGFFACAFALILILADTVLAVSVLVSVVVLLVLAVIVAIIIRVILIKQNLIPSPKR